MGGEERRRANIISGIIILISGVVHSFYYVSVLCLLGTKAILKNPDNPQLYTSPWKGRLREVTRGKVQRAVPKSAHGWGAHAIWGYSMIRGVTIMPLTCSIYHIHTSEPEFFSRAKATSGLQSHKSRKPLLSTRRRRCGTCICTPKAKTVAWSQDRRRPREERRPQTLPPRK